MGYGITVRSKPRIQVLRGFDPMATSGLKQTAFVKSGVTIKSGQAITLEWVAGNSRYEWVLAVKADVLSQNLTVYFADKDSTDGDVLEGGLMGYSSLGDYEIQTAFFTAGTYNVDTLLTISATPGSLAVATGTGTHPIVGKVTRIRGAYALQQAPDANGNGAVYDDSSTLAADSQVIVFTTQTDKITL